MKKSGNVKTIRTLFWDLDKTLWNYDDNQLESYCNILGIVETNVLKYQFEVMLETFDSIFEYQKVTYSDMVWFIENSMPELNNFEISGEKFLRAIQTSKVTSVNPEAEKILKLMNNAGKRNIVLSDWIKMVQIEFLKQHGLLKYMEEVYTSDDGRYLKANKKAKEGIIIPGKEDEYIIIGDSIDKDIVFAKNAGIPSVWYNPKKIGNTNGIKPTYEVTSLLEIADIIK